MNRCKNFQQHASKTNSTAHWKYLTPWSSGVCLGEARMAQRMPAIRVPRASCCILTAKTEPREPPTAVTSWVRTWGGSGHRKHSQMNSSKGGRLAQWLSSQRECPRPAYLTPQVRNTAKKQILGHSTQQRGGGSDRASTEHREGCTQHPGRLWSPHQPNPHPGDGTRLWTNLTHQGADARNSKNCKPAGRRPHTKSDQVRWQGNMMQTEEQDKSLHVQLDEEEISTPSEKEFRVMG